MDFSCFLERKGERMEKCLRVFKRYSIQHVCAIYFFLSVTLISKFKKNKLECECSKALHS